MKMLVYTMSRPDIEHALVIDKLFVDKLQKQTVRSTPERGHHYHHDPHLSKSIPGNDSAPICHSTGHRTVSGI